MRTHDVTTADGRHLEVKEAGPADGVPLVIHHGTPGAAGFYPPWETDAQERGLRLITHSRPGYGHSTWQPDRRVADVAPDVEAIADHLGIDKFLTWGISGGGPHALACAALLPDRVVAAASLAAIAPYDGEGLDFFEGMGEGNVEDTRIFLEGGREATRANLEQQAEEMLEADVEGLIEALSGYLSPVDAKELDERLGEFLLAGTKHALVNGLEGWLDEDFTRPWGFDPKDIRVPTLLWQGRQDAMVPYGHGVWLAGRIPDVEAHLSDEDGHLTLITHRIGEVHGWLLDRWNAAP